MLMAIFKSHWKNGFWNSKRGLEFPLALLAMGVGIGLIGPGSYSLDVLFGIALPETLLFCVLAVTGLFHDLTRLISSRPTPVPATEGKATPPVQMPLRYTPEPSYTTPISFEKNHSLPCTNP